jgi:hypothetical protein
MDSAATLICTPVPSSPQREAQNKSPCQVVHSALRKKFVQEIRRIKFGN